MQDLMRHAAVGIDFPLRFGDSLWQELCDSVEEFKSSESFHQQRERFLAAPSEKRDKSFLIRLSPEPGSVWYKVAEHPLMLGMAREYFGGGNPLLGDCDLWHTEPMPEGRERATSQNWHIDMEAQRFPHRIFKAFLYFNDIEEGNGPLELWMAGSSLQENGPIKVCVSAGTMVLVDTGALLHRGGYCETGPRTVGLWYYTNGSGLQVPPLVYNKPQIERATA